MIIDCHTHLNRYATAEPASVDERRDALLRTMDENGIAHAMVLTSYIVTKERPGTEAVLESVAGEPRLSVVAGVSVRAGLGKQLERLRELAEAKQIRGLKMYPGYEPFDVASYEMAPFYALAADHDLPVMVHTGDTYDPKVRVRYAHPLQIDDAAVSFPQTTFVMCHLGSPWFADAMEVIYKNPNVMADISGLTLGPFEPRFEKFARTKVNEVIAFLNTPDQLMFGTDWPISDTASYLRFVDALDLTAEEREGMLWRNAARLFRLNVEADRVAAD